MLMNIDMFENLLGMVAYGVAILYLYIFTIFFAVVATGMIITGIILFSVRAKKHRATGYISKPLTVTASILTAVGALLLVFTVLTLVILFA